MQRSRVQTQPELTSFFSFSDVFSTSFDFAVTLAAAFLFSYCVVHVHVPRFVILSSVVVIILF